MQNTGDEERLQSRMFVRESLHETVNFCAHSKRVKPSLDFNGPPE